MLAFKFIIMKKLKISLLTLLSFILFSCNDVLDVSPDNRTTIDSAEKIAEILVNAYPNAAYASFLEPMSDNAGDKGPSAVTKAVNEEMFFWRDFNLVDEDTPTFYWNQAYKAIAQANQALLSIEELDGGKEMNHLKGEALVCRAYAHFMLVNIFSKAYDPKTASSDLGIPYVTKPEKVLLRNYDRGTVESVYKNIKADLETGLPLIQDDYYIQPTYHFTKAAAYAFAARFYLTTAEWQKVVDCADIALGGNPLLKLRNWRDNYRPITFTKKGRLYSSSLEPANLLLVSGYSSFRRFYGSARYQLNGDKRDEIFPYPNDTGKAWSYKIYGNDLYYNIPKYWEYFQYTNQAAGIGNPYVTFVLLSSDEVLLNRAEAYAMLGQLNNALNDINMSYSVKTQRYTTSDALTIADVNTKFKVDDNLYTPFYSIPNASLPFIHAVLTIKRTIFYNEGMRWFDNKRHNMEITHTDNNNNKYILTKTDLRRQLQIPEAAQVHGIKANPR